MNEIEKHELLEQRQKIFETGAQRVDKRAGSFNFLTWSFFIAPLIVSEGLQAAPFKIAVADEEDGKAAIVLGAAARVDSEDLPTNRPSKASEDDATVNGSGSLSQTHAPLADPTALLAQPPEDAPKPGTARSEAVVEGSGGGGGGGGGGRDDAEPRVSDGSVLESDQSDAPALVPTALTDAVVTPTNIITGTITPPEAPVAPLLTTVTDTVGTLTDNVTGMIAPRETAVDQVLSTLTSTVSTLSDDVAATIAPVETVVDPVLATLTEAVGTLGNDVAGIVASIEAAAEPVLATLTDTVGALGDDVAGMVAPLEAVAEPVLTTLTDTVGALSDDVTGMVAPLEAVAEPVLTTLTDTVGALSDDVTGMVAPLEAVAEPVLTTLTDTVGALSDDVAGMVVPLQAVAEPVLATLTDTVDTLNGGVTGMVAPIEAAVGPMLTTLTGAVDTLSSEVISTVAPAAVAAPTLLADRTDAVLPIAGDMTPISTDVVSVAPALSHPDVQEALDPAETLIALATATDAPIEVHGSTTAVPADEAADASSPVASVDPAAIAGDVISLDDASGPPTNALFNGTQYTDYGVTLSSDIAIPAPHTVPAADDVSAQDSLVPVIADLQHDAHPQAPPDIVDTAHSIDHLGLRDAIL